MNILVGADPELFIRRGDQYISAYGLIPGTKTEPFPVDKGSVQVDGMAAEFGIDPASTSDEFIFNINTVLNTLRGMIPAGCELVPIASVEFDQGLMDEQPLEAKDLGCSPDFNAHKGGEINERPDGNTNLRTASGHVHVGWCNGVDNTDLMHIETCIQVARRMDVFVGVPSVVYDRDKRRHELYGKAGAFRPTTYGMEYRTPGPGWLTSENRQRLVFNNTQLAVEATMNDECEELIATARRIINSSDVDAAIRFCKMNLIPLGE